MTSGLSGILSSSTVVVPASISVIVIVMAASLTNITRHPLFAIIAFVAVVAVITVSVFARTASSFFVIVTL